MKTNKIRGKVLLKTVLIIGFTGGIFSLILFDKTITPNFIFSMEDITPQPKTIAKLVGNVRVSSFILAIVHLVIVVLSIYFWVVEGRPNFEIFVSLLALIILAIGYIGAMKRKVNLLLVFVVGLCLFLVLEIVSLLIAAVFLILFVFDKVQISSDSSIAFILLSLLLIFLNAIVVALLIFGIRNGWRLRKILIRTRFSVVSTMDGDLPYGEDAMPYMPPEISLEDKAL